MINKDLLNTFNDIEQKIITINGKSIEIDIMIANLIEKLNKKGFTTEFCCSGHNGKVNEQLDNYTHGYIRFSAELDDTRKKDIINIAKSIDNIKYDYVLSICYIDGTIYLKNYTEEEKQLALKILELRNERNQFKEDWQPKISEYIDIRINRNANKQYMEENRIKTYNAFKALEDWIDNYSLKGN